MAEKRAAPIRVLHLISTLDTGGAEQSLLRLVRSMDPFMFANEVVSMTSYGPMATKIEEAGIRVHTLGMRKGRPGIAGVLRAHRITRLFRPHIVQCWMYHANLMGLVLAGPKRVVWNIRCSDIDLAAYGSVYRYTVLAGARLSPIPRAVVVNSLAGRKAHEDLGYHPREWVVIPNGIDPETFRPDEASRRERRAGLGIGGDAIVIGLVGRYDPIKDLPAFFKAAEFFHAIHPGAHFVLAGRGLDTSNTELAKALPRGIPGDHMHLLGEQQDMERFYPLLDILASTSVSEGFPNAVAEAMACGVPCVATDAGDAASIVGDTGIIVQRRSPEQVFRAWLTLASMPQEARRDMGMRARERIRTLFAQDITTKRYCELYLRLSHGSTAGRHPRCAATAAPRL